MDLRVGKNSDWAKKSDQVLLVIFILGINTYQWWGSCDQTRKCQESKHPQLEYESKSLQIFVRWNWYIPFVSGMVEKEITIVWLLIFLGPSLEEDLFNYCLRQFFEDLYHVSHSNDLQNSNIFIQDHLYTEHKTR